MIPSADRTSARGYRRATGPARRLLLLAGLLVLAILPRLYHVQSRYMNFADHNTANTSIYARNLLELGWLGARLGLVTEAWSSHDGERTYFAHHPPTLGILTSLSFLLLGITEPVARLAPLLLSALTCPVLYLLLRRLFEPVWALIGALLFAAAPGAVIYGQMLNQESPVLLIGLLAILCWCRYAESGSAPWWHACLMLLAAGILTDWPGTYIAPALVAASAIAPRTRSRVPALCLQVGGVAAASIAVVFAHILLLKRSFDDIGEALVFRALSSEERPFTWAQHLARTWQQLEEAVTWPIRALAVAGAALAIAWILARAVSSARRRAPGGSIPASERVAVAVAVLIFGALHFVLFSNACYFNPNLSYYLIPPAIIAAMAGPALLAALMRSWLPGGAAAGIALAVTAPFIAAFALESTRWIQFHFNSYTAPGWSILGQALAESTPADALVISTGSAASPQFRHYAWRKILGHRREAGQIARTAEPLYLMRDRNAPLPGEAERLLGTLQAAPALFYDLYSLGPQPPPPAIPALDRPAGSGWDLRQIRFGNRLGLGLHAFSPAIVEVDRLPWPRRYLGVPWTPRSAAGRFVHASFVWERVSGQAASLVPVYSLVHRELGEEVHAPMVWPLEPEDADLADLPEGGSARHEVAFFFGEWLPEGEYLLRAVVLEGDRLLEMDEPDEGLYAILGTVTLRLRH